MKSSRETTSKGFMGALVVSVSSGIQVTPFSRELEINWSSVFLVSSFQLPESMFLNHSAFQPVSLVLAQETLQCCKFNLLCNPSGLDP